MLKKTLAALLFLNLNPAGAMENPLDIGWETPPYPLKFQKLMNQNEQKTPKQINKRKNEVEIQESESDLKKRRMEVTAGQFDIIIEPEIIVEIKSSINYEEDLEKMYFNAQMGLETLYYHEREKFGLLRTEKNKKYTNVDEFIYYINISKIVLAIIDEKKQILDSLELDKTTIATEIRDYLSIFGVCQKKMEQAFMRQQW